MYLVVSFFLSFLPFLTSYVQNSTSYTAKFGLVTASCLKHEQMQTPLVTTKQPSPCPKVQCVPALFRALKYDPSLHFPEDYLVM